MTNGHMYAPTPSSDPVACKRCGRWVKAYYHVTGYCHPCADVLIDNLSPTDIAQVWKKLDEREAADAS